MPTCHTSGASQFCRYCLLPAAGERVPAGFVGFYQWMDPSLAEAWFAKALELTNPTTIAALEHRPYNEQAAHVASIWRALQFGYMALNLPAATDPVYRYMWRKWFVGFPPTGDTSPGQEDIEWRISQYSVPPEVSVIDGKFNREFRFVSGPADLKNTLSFDDSRRSPAERFGIIRSNVAKRVIDKENNISARIRVVYPAFLNAFGLYEFGTWPFISGGPQWDNEAHRIWRDENPMRPSPGDQTGAMANLLTGVSQDAMQNGLNVAAGPYPSGVRRGWGVTDYEFAHYPGIPQIVGNVQVWNGAGRSVGMQGAEDRSRNWDWKTWFRTWAGPHPLEIGGGSMYAGATLFDTIEPARWLAERCSTIDPETNRPRHITGQEIAFRARMDAKLRATNAASSSGSIEAALGGGANAASQMEQWRQTPNQAMEEAGAAIMGIGGAVMAANAYIGLAIMAVGAITSIIGDVIKKDYTSEQARVGTDEFGQWKPSIPWPFISGGTTVAHPPTIQIPAPQGWRRPSAPPVTGLDACQPFNLTTQQAQQAMIIAQQSTSVGRKILPWALGATAIVVTGAAAYFIAGGKIAGGKASSRKSKSSRS